MGQSIRALLAAELREKAPLRRWIATISLAIPESFEGFSSELGVVPCPRPVSID